MHSNGINNQTTTHRVVIPFYAYAAISYLVATILLFANSSDFTQHYFQPTTLALTHVMALGWGTMIILGSSHQLIPVLSGEKLYSNFLAQLSFYLCGLGIPLLVYGFYHFNMQLLTQCGGLMIVLGMLSYLFNSGITLAKSRTGQIHAIFIFTAVLWLLFTALFGVLLVFNFTKNLFPNDSYHYLSLHAHSGLVGWFLLLIMGVGSRLIPMFLISKYKNNQLLWWVYACINAALLVYLIQFSSGANPLFHFFPALLLFIGIGLFIYFGIQTYKGRLRKQVDEQMQISLLSIGILVIPVFILLVILFLLNQTKMAQPSLILAYGFCILFGWLTALILGMTFKTLPFIVWNKVYHHHAAAGLAPGPKTLFNNTLFNYMAIFYLVGILLFVLGILLAYLYLLKFAAFLLILSAVFYNWNIFHIISHKPKTP